MLQYIVTVLLLSTVVVYSSDTVTVVGNDVLCGDDMNYALKIKDDLFRVKCVEELNKKSLVANVETTEPATDEDIIELEGVDANNNNIVCASLKFKMSVTATYELDWGLKVANLSFSQQVHNFQSVGAKKNNCTHLAAKFKLPTEGGLSDGDHILTVVLSQDEHYQYIQYIDVVFKFKENIIYSDFPDISQENLTVTTYSVNAYRQNRDTELQCDSARELSTTQDGCSVTTSMVILKQGENVEENLPVRTCVEDFPKIEIHIHAIAGGIVGAIILVVIVGSSTLFVCRRKGSKSGKKKLGRS